MGCSGGRQIGHFEALRKVRLLKNSQLTFFKPRNFSPPFSEGANLDWNGPFRFIHATDTQFGLIEELTLRAADRWKEKNRASSFQLEEVHLAQQAIKEWNEMTPKPAFVAITGDLVNDKPKKDLHRDDQLAAFKRTFSKLDPSIPLVLLPGKRDLLKKPREATIEAYRADFGDDYFSFAVGGVLFLALNVQLNKNPDKVADLAAEHDRWLDRQLEEAAKGQKGSSQAYKHIIVLQHIPWFLRDIHEPKEKNVTLFVKH